MSLFFEGFPLGVEERAFEGVRGRERFGGVVTAILGREKTRKLLAVFKS